MPRFGRTSRVRLYSCHPELQRLFETVVNNYDCSVIYGVRTKEQQQKLLEIGATRTLKSKHLKHVDGWSHAVDVAPYPIDWDNTKRFYWFGGIVQATADSLGIKIRWGGDWDSDNDLDDQKFMDLVHFELVQ